MHRARLVPAAVRRHPWRAAAALVLVLGGCATMRGLMALRQVDFEVDRVASLRLAGVSLDRIRNPSEVGVLDAARIAAAVAQHRIPLGFDLHILGRNPADNNTTARLVRMTWTLALNGRETISGTLDTAYTFAPGVATDIRVPIALDLWQFFQSSASDALNLALGLAGIGSQPTEVSVRAVPIIDTPLGAIQYPSPITIVRRTVGGP